MKKSIVLIGFMGVGKTTVGQELARKLQRKFIDTDLEIEANYGMKATEIFKVHGEKQFRETEKEIISRLAELEDKVLSVGGGAFLQDVIRDTCLKHNFVIFLDLSWEEWNNRLTLLRPTRPNLQNKSEAEIKQLFEERQKIYKHHHLRIDTDGLGIDAIVERIMEELKLLS